MAAVNWDAQLGMAHISSKARAQDKPAFAPVCDCSYWYISCHACSTHMLDDYSCMQQMGLGCCTGLSGWPHAGLSHMKPSLLEGVATVYLRHPKCAYQHRLFLYLSVKVS